MLKVEKINVFYEDLQVLWDVSFEVEKGSVTSIIGSNGAGKTTILRTVSGLVKPKSGTIKFLDGVRLDRLPPHKIAELGVAHVPEGRHLFTDMTVRENLEMGAYTIEARKKRDETLEWIYQLFPILKEREKQIAGTLSGGEQQMLTIARGLMLRPKLLMLDEPSYSLAPKLVLKIFDTLRRINEEGITILLVEQNVGHSLTLADKAYVLESGRVTLHGAGQELLENPQVKKSYLGM